MIIIQCNNIFHFLCKADKILVISSHGSVTVCPKIQYTIKHFLILPSQPTFHPNDEEFRLAKADRTPAKAICDPLG